MMRAASAPQPASRQTGGLKTNKSTGRTSCEGDAAGALIIASLLLMSRERSYAVSWNGSPSTRSISRSALPMWASTGRNCPVGPL
jgi:hypothetical protein